MLDNKLPLELKKAPSLLKFSRELKHDYLSFGYPCVLMLSFQYFIFVVFNFDFLNIFVSHADMSVKWSTCKTFS